MDSALLAQPITASVDVREGSLVGVRMPRLHPRLESFSPHYGPAATAASLDVAGARYAALLPELIRLAEEEEAARNLQAGLVKTVRRLKALEQVVIPRLEREVHHVAPRSKRRNETTPFVESDGSTADRVRAELANQPPAERAKPPSDLARVAVRRPASTARSP